MTTRLFSRRVAFLIAALLLAVTAGAKPVYAVDAADTAAAKAEKQKKAAEEKQKKPRETAPTPVTDRYPNDNKVPGMAISS